MKVKKFLLSLACVSIGILSVPVSAEPLPTVNLVSVTDAVKPTAPENTGYAVVNLNIRKEPDKNSEIVGRYEKGTKITILDHDETWAHTDKGYVWGGYLASTYGCSLAMRSDSENASYYVGYVYDILNKIETKYLKYLEPYDICVCDNPWLSYYGESAPEKNNLTNGLTHLSEGNGVHERLLFLRANKEALDDAVYHELGHVIDYHDFSQDVYLSDAQVVTDSMESERQSLKEKYGLSDANTATNAEYFAEVFRLSFDDPDGLSETAPGIAAYMEKVKTEL